MGLSQTSMVACDWNARSHIALYVSMPSIDGSAFGQKSAYDRLFPMSAATLRCGSSPAAKAASTAA